MLFENKWITTWSIYIIIIVHYITNFSAYIKQQITSRITICTLPLLLFLSLIIEYRPHKIYSINIGALKACFCCFKVPHCLSNIISAHTGTHIDWFSDPFRIKQPGMYPNVVTCWAMVGNSMYMARKNSSPVFKNAFGACSYYIYGIIFLFIYGHIHLFDVIGKFHIYVYTL